LSALYINTIEQRLMFIKLYQENPNPKQLRTITECLLDGGIIIYPTDTIYGFGCSISKPKAIARIAKLKGIQAREHNFTLMCKDMSQMSQFVKPISNHLFRILNKTLPGPYTFILPASKKVPEVIHRKKKSIGIRIPDNNITLSIINYLDNPILNSSVLHDDDVLEYRTDPELIYDRYKNLVDIVVDGGYGDNNPSSLIDCTQDELIVIREGKGKLDFLY
jgi:tRNA threonylcarbamoyl adenosine modification protein (Sua5/YciO/YrdC/YwlC family)